jgi:hypothetical protein
MLLSGVLLANVHWVVGSIVYFVIWLLIMAWIYALARRKGRHAILWLIAGFFFSLIALIILLILPNKRKTRAA